MSFGISRRAFLGAVPFSLAAQVKTAPQKKPRAFPDAGEFLRIIDPVTENTIVRLTSPSSTSLIPLPRHRFVSSRERILIFSSDRGGHFAPHQIDLRTGLIKQLAETSQLKPRSLGFDRQEKLVRYLDGDSIFEVGLNRGSPKRVAEDCSAFSSAADGSLYLIATGGKLVRKQGSDERTLAEGVSDVWPQPNGGGCLYARSTADGECELQYIGLEAAAKPTSIANGRLSEPFWDADGESILFLRAVVAPSGVPLAEIHGRSIHGGDEYLVSTTSQFACFAPNSDASVFVGASRSKAQPVVVLLLRSPHREMTLCEHHSSQAAAVLPAFSPDNRRVYFESDREGRSALYSVNVELLVEPQG